MKKSSDSSRYLQPIRQTYQGGPFEYTGRQREKVASYFLKESQESALKETVGHVSKLVGLLSSRKTSQNIKRKESLRQAKKLLSLVQALKDGIQPSLQVDLPHYWVKIQHEFLTLNSWKYPAITLDELDELLRHLEWSCSKFIDHPGGPGRKNPYFYETIANLVVVWEKYSGRKATRYYNPYKKTRPHEEGKFIKYLIDAIDPAICYIEKKQRNKSPIFVSIPHLAREVIRERSLMAKNSSK